MSEEQPRGAKVLFAEPQMSTEVYVFGDHLAAAAAGFVGGSHHEYPWMRAVWLTMGPEIPYRLRGATISRVTITPDALRYALRNGPAYDTLARMRSNRSMFLRVPPMVWIEL